MNTPPPDALILAYDGDCGFCQASIDRIRTWAAPSIPAMPWQSLPDDITAPHLTRLDSEVLLLHNGSVRSGGAQALAAFTGSSASRPFRIAAALINLPGLRRGVHHLYRWVARNRHRLPGATTACALPASRT
jgi:predicted DCC family thiol-disulfide oxidoreductase YuxK